MNKTNEILERRVEKILPSKEGLQKLMQTRKIKLYQGIDPTATRLHLGHTIGLRKLMEFANLGHEVIFLFGTGTVLVGDPSLRDSARKVISDKEIENNIKNWKQQVSPIIDFNKIKIVKNSDWLLKLTLKDIINIASKVSAIQLFKRESFQRRLNQGDTVWYHETMYPLLQGYDSVVMDVDLEIGGTDQEFNMLMGRELQKKFRNKEKYVLTVPMVQGTDNKQMSKTSGNCIWLDDSPEDMYGKLMRITDNQIKPYMELLTNTPLSEINNLPNNPLQNKKRLALDITTQFYETEKALKAQKHFETVFQKKNIAATTSSSVSSVTTTTTLPPGIHTALGTISQALPEKSHSEIKRIIKQGGVEWNGKKITDFNQNLEVKGGEILKFGKHIFKKVQINS